MHSPKPFYRRFNDAWYVQLGKKQIQLAKGKANEKEAQRRFYQVMAEEDPTRLLASPGSQQVATVCDLFLEWSAKHNEPETYQWRKRFLQDFCDDYGTVKVTEVKPFHLTRWLDRHAWNSTSRRSAIACVKRAFNWAVDEGMIAGNPFRKVRKPPGNRREVILAPEQQQAIRDACRDQCFKDFLFALQETGCRPGEIAIVTANDLNVDAGTWRLAKHKTVHKTGTPRMVYLTEPMITLCRELAAKHPQGPIFRNRYGKPWSRNAVRCRFRQLRKKLNLTGVVAYTYRHTYVTQALINGVDLISLSELVGHTDLTMLKHYQHLAKNVDHLRKAAERARRPA